MYCYRCIVTPKNICIFVLCSIRVAPDWNFEIMKTSSNLLVLKCLKIDAAVNSFFFLNTTNNVHLYKQGIQTFLSPETFVRQLSLVVRRKFDFEQCCLSCYLLIELISDILDMASYNRDKVILSVTIVSIEIVKKIRVWPRKTFIDSYWQMTKCLGTAVISGLVRIMIRYVRQIEKQKGCSADSTRSESSLKTSFGWVYCHQDHII